MCLASMQEKAKYEKELQGVASEKAKASTDNGILSGFSLTGAMHSEEELVRLIADRDKAAKYEPRTKTYICIYR
jgi:hypothetical protein